MFCSWWMSARSPRLRSQLHLLSLHARTLHLRYSFAVATLCLDVGILRWRPYTYNIHCFHILWQLMNCDELWRIVIIVARSWPSMWRGSLTEVRRPGTDTWCLYNANRIQYAPGALTTQAAVEMISAWYDSGKDWCLAEFDQGGPVHQ